MSIQDERDLASLRAVGRIVREVLDAMKAEVRPGVSTRYLDEIGRNVAFESVSVTPQVAGRIVDGVKKRRDDWGHHDFGHALRPLVGVNGRQYLDLKPLKRKVRPACDEVLAEVPFPVAGSVLVKRQRLKQCIADTHGEAALRLSQHDLRD